MTELALQTDGGVLSLVERTPTSLTLPVDLPYEDFEDLLALLGTAENAFLWWTSDALLQGEHLYGDKVAQAAELLGRSPQTVINRVSTARRVPPERRNPRVSFTAHAEVAALEPAEQKRWLKVAEDEDLRTHELRERIRSDKMPGNVLPSAVSKDDAAAAVWHSSTRAVGDVFLVPAEPMLTLRDAFDL